MAKATTKTVKECPNCRATLFQGPFARGSFTNGKFEKKEELWQCVNCNRVMGPGDLVDREVPAPEDYAIPA